MIQSIFMCVLANTITLKMILNLLKVNKPEGRIYELPPLLDTANMGGSLTLLDFFKTFLYFSDIY